MCSPQLRSAFLALIVSCTWGRKRTNMRSHSRHVELSAPPFSRDDAAKIFSCAHAQFFSSFVAECQAEYDCLKGKLQYGFVQDLATRVFLKTAAGNSAFPIVRN